MGRGSGFKAQVTDVGGVLGAVSKMTEAGKIVIFDEIDGHRIIDRQTGRVTPMRKENGVFKTSIWVKSDKPQPDGTTKYPWGFPDDPSIKYCDAEIGVDQVPFQGLDNELI